uniref:Uncharacterized protein n=1 Tax=viral metagenome TaxID=1070528 RepID=A0A6M3LMX1_9ZZZZ
MKTKSKKKVYKGQIKFKNPDTNCVEYTTCALTIKGKCPKDCEWYIDL